MRLQNSKREDRIIPRDELNRRVEEVILKDNKRPKELIPRIPAVETAEKVAKVALGSLPATKDQFDVGQSPPTLYEIKQL